MQFGHVYRFAVREKEIQLVNGEDIDVLVVDFGHAVADLISEWTLFDLLRVSLREIPADENGVVAPELEEIADGPWESLAERSMVDWIKLTDICVAEVIELLDSDGLIEATLRSRAFFKVVPTL